MFETVSAFAKKYNIKYLVALSLILASCGSITDSPNAEQKDELNTLPIPTRSVPTSLPNKPAAPTPRPEELMNEISITSSNDPLLEEEAYFGNSNRIDIKPPRDVEIAIVYRACEEVGSIMYMSKREGEEDSDKLLQVRPSDLQPLVNLSLSMVDGGKRFYTQSWKFGNGYPSIVIARHTPQSGPAVGIPQDILFLDDLPKHPCGDGSHNNDIPGSSNGVE